jgi:urease accessory protein
MPTDASGLAYGLGFMLATAVLHLIGIGIGLGIGVLAKTTSRRIVQAGGGIMTVAGLAILTGFI